MFCARRLSSKQLLSGRVFVASRKRACERERGLFFGPRGKRKINRKERKSEREREKESKREREGDSGNICIYRYREVPYNTDNDNCQTQDP